LQGVELGVGRICNLKCRSCNVVLSTKWEADVEKREDTYIPEINEMDFSSINLDHWDQVKQIKVTGGEPLLHKKFLKFLQELISRGYSQQIELEVYTNGFLRPSEDSIETLKQFGSLIISISVDAIGPKNDYIRHPSRWDDVEKTMSFWGDYLNHLPEARMQMASTISHFNVLDSVEILDWTLSEYPNIFPIFQMVQNPEHLNVSLLPYELRQEITTRLKKEMDQVSFEGRSLEFANKCMSKVFSYLGREGRRAHPLEEFYRETKRLDQLRGESFEKEFPEIHELLAKHHHGLE
jgi:MoaA/NifB/PqqE/SkfB family radical SAM enzyme